MGLISLHHSTRDFDSRNSYQVPAIQYKQPEILQDPYSQEFQIRPTGIEHDRPVVSMSHLAAHSGRTQNRRAFISKTPSSNMDLGAYQVIVQKAIN